MAGTLLVVREEPLFADPNDAIICRRHVAHGDTGSQTQRISKAEAAEWRGYVLSQYGADASACEYCRAGMSFMRP